MKVDIIPATPDQLALLCALIEERQITDLDIPETLDRGMASELIDRALSYPKIKREPAAEGLYLRDGEVYAVVPTKDMARVYAKLLAFSGEGYVTARWKMASGMVTRLTPADRLTLAQAQEIGRTRGICPACAKHLVDADSFANGVHAVCGKRLER